MLARTMNNLSLFGVNFLVTWTFKKISLDVVRNEKVALKKYRHTVVPKGNFFVFCYQFNLSGLPS